MKLFLAVLINFASALYFEINERDKKCFIEELPDDTQMIGKYLVQVFDKNDKVAFFPLNIYQFESRRGKSRRQVLECMSKFTILAISRSSRVHTAPRDGLVDGFW